MGRTNEPRWTLFNDHQIFIGNEKDTEQTFAGAMTPDAVTTDLCTLQTSIIQNQKGRSTV